MILKKRDIADCQLLYHLITDPAVYPFVRHKPSSYDEYVFLTKQAIEAEERGELVSRTIVDEWGTPIGTINLYDICEQSGFLGTWIGKPYFGKGYNRLAKEAFFEELFFEKNITTIYMRIRKENVRSYQAAMKLPFCMIATELPASLLIKMNKTSDYHFFKIEKDQYLLYKKRQPVPSAFASDVKEA